MDKQTDRKNKRQKRQREENTEKLSDRVETHRSINSEIERQILTRRKRYVQRYKRTKGVKRRQIDKGTIKTDINKD